jgi:hypothetical protein
VKDPIHKQHPPLANEAGRTYYQRVSRFYPGYSEAETGKQ